MQTTLDTTLGVQLARQVLEDANKPMSIDQIRAKFQVEFPFQVRKVIDLGKGSLPIGATITVLGFVKDYPGGHMKHMPKDSYYIEGISPGYNYEAVLGDLKQWVLV